MNEDTRAIVIMNPAADNGRALDLRDRIAAWGLEVLLSESAGHARTLAEQAVRDGYDLVIAAGGDGTVHEVTNGLVHGGRAQATLALLPIGSGNDFAYSMGLLRPLDEAYQIIRQGHVRQVDMARIEDDHGRYELINNSIGIGFDAMVTINSESITRVHGFARYTLAALRTIAFFYKTPHLQIDFDDEHVEQDSLMLSLGLGPRAGGGFYLTPDAVPDDDLVDSCLVNPVNRPTMLWMLPKVMRGTHITSKHVTMRRSRYVDVRSDIPMPIHIDGEIFAYLEDNVHRVTISSQWRALSVITPPEAGR
jgi:diacylglycerol kinase (ATP)